MYQAIPRTIPRERHYMKRAVFLDLDGTFWIWGRVPSSAEEALARAQANGHKILCNTGRTRAGVSGLEPYRLDGYCFGAGSDVEIDGRQLVQEPLGTELAQQMLALLDGWHLNFSAEGRERTFMHFVDREAAFKTTPWGEDAADDDYFNSTDVSLMTPDDYAQIYKFCLFGVSLNAKQCAALPESMVFTDFGFAGEITQRRVTKGTAMEAVRSYLEQTTGEAWCTMAFGDSDNDIPMLQSADISVCMGNGNDRAKEAADYVTTDIDADGLLHAFEHFGLV